MMVCVCVSVFVSLAACRAASVQQSRGSLWGVIQTPVQDWGRRHPGSTHTHRLCLCLMTRHWPRPLPPSWSCPASWTCWWFWRSPPPLPPPPAGSRVAMTTCCVSCWPTWRRRTRWCYGASMLLLCRRTSTGGFDLWPLVTMEASVI